MASTPRRWLWIVNVVAIVLGAWLVAGTVDAMVASKVGAAPSLPAGHGGATTAIAPSTRPLDNYLGPIKARNIFNHGEAIPDEDVPVTGQPSAPAGACTSNIQLLSTVIASRNPDLSLATIQDKSQNPPAIQVVQVGELLGDATVTSVTEEYDEDNLQFVSSLELTHSDGRKEICKSNDANTGGASVAVSMPMSGGAQPAAPNGSTIKRVDDGHYVVAQSEIDGVMNGGLANISQDVRIVPYFEGGVPKGFKMYSIKPGSLLAQIGLMNGDVIEKINGYDISSPEKALQVYSLLKNEKSVSVDLTRNGQNKSISYTIQ
jgi:general secretion pathway protein C